MQTNQHPDSWHENLIRLRLLCLEDLEAIQTSVEEPAIAQEADEGQPDESPATSAPGPTELEEILRNANKGGRGVSLRGRYLEKEGGDSRRTRLVMGFGE